MEFIDTNILVYLFDAKTPHKQRVAIDLVRRLTESRNCCVSLQVLQEFFVVTTGKLRLPPERALRHVRQFSAWPLHRPVFEDLTEAMELNITKKASFWDALLIRSARKMNCTVLWTEDLKHGDRFGDLVIRNPFLTQ